MAELDILRGDDSLTAFKVEVLRQLSNVSEKRKVAKAPRDSGKPVACAESLHFIEIFNSSAGRNNYDSMVYLYSLAIM